MVKVVRMHLHDRFLHISSVNLRRMNPLFPSLVMDCPSEPHKSMESSISRNVLFNFDPKFALKHPPIRSISSLLPNFQHGESSGCPNKAINSFETNTFFRISCWNQTVIPHSDQKLSNILQYLTSSMNPGAKDKHPWLRFGRELGQRIHEGKACLGNIALGVAKRRQRELPCFASVSASEHGMLEPKRAFDLALSTEHVAKTLEGVPVYTVSNANNEFVLISDPNSQKSLGLLCFRQEDAEALLAQVQHRQPVLSQGAKVVPLSLDKVYSLKVEGIAFRFLPDPVQIRNALEIRAKDFVKAFDGVPVFQSDLVVKVMKKSNRRICPLYFRKEDLEREVLKVLKTQPKSARSSDILVGSLEDVLKKMEENKNNSGWEDLVFIPPGKSYTEHIQKILV